ncbi:hypothetical protein D3C87_1987010 [compost metagenome]
MSGVITPMVMSAKASGPKATLAARVRPVNIERRIVFPPKNTPMGLAWYGPRARLLENREDFLGDVTPLQCVIMSLGV